MAGVKQYEVTGAVAVIPTKDGSERYMYRGAPVSEDAFTAEGIKHVLSIGLISEVKAVEKTTDDEPYKGVNVADLKSEIEKRNEGREDDKKIVPAEPGHRPEIVAALVADDAAAAK